MVNCVVGIHKTTNATPPRSHKVTKGFEFYDTSRNKLHGTTNPHSEDEKSSTVSQVRGAPHHVFHQKDISSDDTLIASMHKIIVASNSPPYDVVLVNISPLPATTVPMSQEYVTPHDGNEKNN